MYGRIDLSGVGVNGQESSGQRFEKTQLVSCPIACQRSSVKLQVATMGTGLPLAV